MNYLSTKELSEAWDVSISLIVRLAKAGRIPGAKLVGKSWVFPADAEKPKDKRKKALTADTPKSTFHFPLYMYLPYSDSEVRNTFSEEEQALYEAERLFHQGDVAAAVVKLEQLYLDNPGRYVRYGVLYYLSIGNIHLHNYTKACQYYHAINHLFLKETAHQHELALILYDLETFFAGNEQFLSKDLLAFPNAFPPDMQGYLLLVSAYTDLLHALISNDRINTAPYQIICDHSLTQYSDLCQIVLLMYTALLLYSQQSISESRHYLLKSCLLARENNMLNAVIFVFGYYPELFKGVLENEDPMLLDQLNRLAGHYQKAFNGLLIHLKKTEVFQLLSPGDYQLLSIAKNGATHKEIAAALHLSPATISKRFAVLYEKTGTHNKNELLKLCADALINY